jgi:hypothetical protein
VCVAKCMVVRLIGSSKEFHVDDCQPVIADLCSLARLVMLCMLTFPATYHGRVFFRSDIQVPWHTESLRAHKLVRQMLGNSVDLFEDRENPTSKVFVEGFEGFIESSFTETA